MYNIEISISVTKSANLGGGTRRASTFSGDVDFKKEAITAADLESLMKKVRARTEALLKVAGRD